MATAFNKIQAINGFSKIQHRKKACIFSQQSILRKISPLATESPISNRFICKTRNTNSHFSFETQMFWCNVRTSNFPFSLYVRWSFNANKAANVCALNYVIHRGAALRSMTAEKKVPILISRTASFITTYKTHPDWSCYLTQNTCPKFDAHFSDCFCFFALLLLWMSKLKIQSLRILYALTHTSAA